MHSVFSLNICIHIYIYMAVVVKTNGIPFWVGVQGFDPWPYICIYTKQYIVKSNSGIEGHLTELSDVWGEVVLVFVCHRGNLVWCLP